MNGLAAHVRDLMVAADERTVQLLETSEQIAKRYVAQAKALPVQWYYAAMKLLSDCDFIIARPQASVCWLNSR